MSQDFNKGKIYKITNDYNDEVYIGSTCDTLNRRFIGHKGGSKKEQCKNTPIYKLMNEIGFERFRIELIEDFPCQDKYQLRQREGHFIRELGTLNKRIENRTAKEYQKDNKDKRLEYKKEYYKNNKEHIQEIHKEYQKDNKEQILKQRKSYYESNKDKFLDDKKEKITCECGCIIGRGDIQRHKRTIKHQELMKTILTPIAD